MNKILKNSWFILSIEISCRWCWRFLIELIAASPDVRIFFKNLQEYVHYIPVKRDLSDLIEKTNWILNNYNENTNVFCYYIGVALIFININKYINFIYSNNYNILRFNHKNINNYIKFIINFFSRNKF